MTRTQASREAQYYREHTVRAPQIDAMTPYDRPPGVRKDPIPGPRIALSVRTSA